MQITRLYIYLLLFLTLPVSVLNTLLHADPSYSFKVIVLGSGGGPDESNLSSYLISTTDSNNYVALDAGTILHGIEIAIREKSFDDVRIPENPDIKPAFYLLQNNIKAYLLTHAHLDHIAGLITASPYDTSKNIYGLPSTVEYISNNLFNWQIWPNFGKEGKKPNLNKYSYVKMSPGKVYSLENSSLKFEAFPLSHSNNYISTAFLIRSNSKYILYIGDTGPDIIENSDKLNKLWTFISPLIISKKLKALFIECSFPNERSDNTLYGHLTPKWLMYELSRLSSIVNKYDNLNKTLAGLPVIITHIKQETGSGLDSKSIIKKQLDDLNNLNLKLVFPEQSEKLLF